MAFSIEKSTPVSLVGIAPGAHQDSGGRLRMSTPTPLFNGVFHYGIHPATWQTIQVTSGTVVYNSNANNISLTAPATGSRAMVTSSNIRYQPGFSQWIKGTGNFKSPAGELAVVIRSSTSGSVVNTRAIQSAFNRDKLDGTGASGFTLDNEKDPLLLIQFLHLGVGPVQFITMKENGEFVLAHMFENPNSNVGMYMASGTLPFRVEIVRDATNIYKRIGYFDDNDGVYWEVKETDLTKNTFTFNCGSVDSEGGQTVGGESGFPRSASTEDTPQTIGATLEPVLSIRPKLSFKSKNNKGSLVPIGIGATATSRDVYVAVYLNASLTGASWTSRDDESLAEFDVSASALNTTGAILIDEFHVVSGNTSSVSSADLLGKIEMRANWDFSSSDILTIACQRIAQNADVSASVRWKELRL